MSYAPKVIHLPFSLFKIPDIFFQVMVQKHNRQMSFSFYISALAVSDTVVLLGGK